MPQIETTVDENGQDLNDIEIAELANNELKKKEAEIAKLKRDLAKEKLFSVAPNEEDEVVTREDCIRKLGDNHISNYDYAKTIVDFANLEESEGRPNPLGSDGEKVCDFLKDVIEECNDDKSRFCSVYQSKIGNDNPQSAMGYKNRR